jgi:2-phosphosulfolactate phosphatase
MEFRRLTLQECHQATGTVVVIDVVRAFTTAAFAFAAGAREIVLTESVEEAFALRDRFRGASLAGDRQADVLLMGEHGGMPIEGFDLGNSPAALVAPALAASDLDLCGRRLIQRTSAGTRGVVCASAGADALLAASLVVGRATARHLRRLEPDQVTFVITGTHGRGPLDGDEDAAGADYIQALLARSEIGAARSETGRSDGGTAGAGLPAAPCCAASGVDPAPFARRVRESFTGRLFGTPAYPHLAAADIDLCVDVDRFDFCMRVEREDGLLVMRPVYV